MEIKVGWNPNQICTCATHFLFVNVSWNSLFELSLFFRRLINNNLAIVMNLTPIIFLIIFYFYAFQLMLDTVPRKCNTMVGPFHGKSLSSTCTVILRCCLTSSLWLYICLSPFCWAPRIPMTRSWQQIFSF